MTFLDNINSLLMDHQAVREVEKALGGVSYELTDKMKKSREFSRSLFIVKDVKEGGVF